MMREWLGSKKGGSGSCLSSSLLLSLWLFLVGNTTCINTDQTDLYRWERLKGVEFRPHMEQVDLNKRRGCVLHCNMKRAQTQATV